MKKFAVLRQFTDWTPRVEDMFNEREDAELFAKLKQKNEKDPASVKYWVFEQSK